MKDSFADNLEILTEKLLKKGKSGYKSRIR